MRCDVWNSNVTIKLEHWLVGFAVSISGLGCGARSGLPSGLVGGAPSISGSAATDSSGRSTGGGSTGGSTAGANVGAGGYSVAGSTSTTCVEEPCANAGRCVPDRNSFACDCPPGTFGDRCETHIVQIAAAYQHVCALLSDATVRCWGRDLSGSVNDTPAADTFRAVAVSGSCNPGGCAALSCGLHIDGSLECWGEQPLAAMPAGPFEHIALEANDARIVCGVKLDGTLSCSTPSSGQPIELEGRFEKVAIGGLLVCGLRPSGVIACFNLPDAQALPERPGPYIDLAFEVDAWALTRAGTLECLREPCGEPPTGGPFTAIAAAAGFAGHELCALQADGELRCPSRSPGDERYRAVSVGVGLDCGLLLGGGARCWSRNDLTLVGQALPPAGPFDSISAGTASTCGLTHDGHAECWGDHTEYSYYDYLEHRVITEPPDSVFDFINLEGDLACGVRKDTTTLECWGDWRWDGRAALPEGHFRKVFPDCNCALSASDWPVCWGAERPVFPDFALRELSCRAGQSCAVDADSQLSCYPAPSMGDVPPKTRLYGVSAGARHSCAIEVDTATVRCWGDDSRGQASPPASAFTAVSCGDEHCCAIGSKQEIRCWGANDFGQASPRPGVFKQVTAGGKHSCGLRVDGSVSCWGELFY